jgi:hypothetical protein
MVAAFFSPAQRWVVHARYSRPPSFRNVRQDRWYSMPGFSLASSGA